ncbi:MAG: hypothetical protein H3C54_10860 [Taibaiella sp.]|nr:hypothetical protein [Taibaiella sp.]
MPVNIIITAFFELLAIMAGLYCWKELSLPYRFLLVQVVLAIIFEITGWAINKFLFVNNLWLFNIYVIIEVWLLGLVCSMFITTKKIKTLIRLLLVLITIGWIAGVIVKGFFEFNNWVVVAMAIFCVVFYMIALFNSSIFGHKKVLAQPFFLVAIAIIIYYATIIPLIGLMNQLVRDNLYIANRLFKINASVAILRYALIAIAFYLYGRQAKRAHVA